jgi:hypothetical protein
MTDTTHTSGQLKLTLKLLEEKGMTPERFGKLHSSGFFADLCDPSAHLTDRRAFRRALKLDEMAQDQFCWIKVKLGLHKNGVELLEALKERGIEANLRDLVAHPNFKIAPQGTVLEVLRLRPKTWGKDARGRETLEGSFYTDMVEDTEKDGLKKLSLEAALEFFLQVTPKHWGVLEGGNPQYHVVCEPLEGEGPLILTMWTDIPLMGGADRTRIRVRTSHYPDEKYRGGVFPFAR